MKENERTQKQQNMFKKSRSSMTMVASWCNDYWVKYNLNYHDTRRQLNIIAPCPMNYMISAAVLNQYDLVEYAKFTGLESTVQTQFEK